MLAFASGRLVVSKFATLARAPNPKSPAVFRLRIRNHFLVRKTEQRDGTHSPRMFSR